MIQWLMFELTDNIDLAVQGRHLSSTHYNSMHWKHAFAVKHIVEIDGSLVREVPQKKMWRI